MQKQLEAMRPPEADSQPGTSALMGTEAFQGRLYQRVVPTAVHWLTKTRSVPEFGSQKGITGRLSVVFNKESIECKPVISCHHFLTSNLVEYPQFSQNTRCFCLCFCCLLMSGKPQASPGIAWLAQLVSLRRAASAQRLASAH